MIVAALQAHRLVITAGLVCDIFGATLVGIEAIKVKNLQRLDALVNELGRRLVGPAAPSRMTRRFGEFFHWSSFFIFLALFAGAIWALPALLGGDLSIWGYVWRGALVFYGIGAAVFLFGYVVLMFVSAVARVVGGVENPEDGRVGIVGIMLLLVGFALELTATWTG